MKVEAVFAVLVNDIVDFCEVALSSGSLAALDLQCEANYDDNVTISSKDTKDERTISLRNVLLS